MNLITFQKLGEFDAYEIHPCLIVGKGEDGKEIVEQCDVGDPRTAFWGLYGHLKTGGLEHIEDYATQSEAEHDLEQTEKQNLNHHDTPTVPT